MRFKKFFLLLICSFSLVAARADEGMWLPQLLQKLNESRMKSLGMKISAADIYSINKGSLKDAVVSFGGFCTGEIISEKGLVLTNHHCGFSAIQTHSSLQNNYIRDGFWAKNNSEELPNKGLFVTFIVRIEDVSKAAMEGISGNMKEAEREAKIAKNLAVVKENFKLKPTEKSFTRGFFEGNQYYLFVTETYTDVRLVGAPPSSIGNFGKDTDNWVWPRHTGDFSMFRIYANKNNEPADYSVDNVPFKPKKSLSISLDGIKENDFTLVFGFPGRTSEYLVSDAVEDIVAVSDPAKINIRTKALKVIDGFMRADEGIKIQYASKYAGISNAWKKWQGEVLGLTRTNAVAKKLAYEDEFQKRVMANPVWKAAYGNVIADLKSSLAGGAAFRSARDYYTEIFSKIELNGMALQLKSLQDAYKNNGEAGYQKRLPQVQASLTGTLKDFNDKVDRAVFEALIPLYVAEQPKQFVAPVLTQWLEASDDSYASLTNKLYSQSAIFNEASLKDVLAKNSSEALAEMGKWDAIKLFDGLRNHYVSEVADSLKFYQDEQDRLQRTYMQAQLEVMKDRKFYPDANSTMRVAFGQVKGYSGKDAVMYNYATNMDGIMEKYVPGDYEFDLPKKLVDLYNAKDFGPYGKDGIMPVCFIATNHTTGGNSGSPVLDAYGNLIGLNFDRAWEGTMSDINYDASICRNIQVDIRYILFIVDKFAGAKYLVDEMKIVHPKTKK